MEMDGKLDGGSPVSLCIESTPSPSCASVCFYRYSPFLMACYNPESEEFQSVCRVMSGFSDDFYKEVSFIVIFI
jgi:hypothetical protein